MVRVVGFNELYNAWEEQFISLIDEFTDDSSQLEAESPLKNQIDSSTPRSTKGIDLKMKEVGKVRAT
jgi:hypothetical protein